MSLSSLKMRATTFTNCICESHAVRFKILKLMKLESIPLVHSFLQKHLDIKCLLSVTPGSLPTRSSLASGRDVKTYFKCKVAFKAIENQMKQDTDTKETGNNTGQTQKQLNQDLTEPHLEMKQQVGWQTIENELTAVERERGKAQSHERKWHGHGLPLMNQNHP